MDDAVDALRDRLLDHLIGFVADLRRRGVRVPATASIDGARALAAVGLDDADQARAALRAAIVTHEGDIETFDALFPEFWRAVWGGDDPDAWEPPEMHAPPGTATEQHRTETTHETSTDASTGDDGAVEAGDPPPERQPSEGAPEDESNARFVETAVYSPSGPSRPIEREDTPRLPGPSDDVAAAVGELGTAIAELRGRRWDRSGTDRLDARRVLRRSIATGGTVSELPHTAHATTETRAVLLVDVSQSVLDTIDRDALVRMLAEIHARWRRVRTFFFDTELREVTDAFERTDPDRAYAALAAAETRWGGGTRIGHAIESATRPSVAAIDRETAVFVISDGLEMGDIDRLEQAMAALDRRSRAVLWLNPLAADPEYEPACRGMQAAIPHVDGLFSFTGPDDLREIARQLRQRGPGGHIGYEFDRRRIEAGTGRTTS